MKNNTLTIFTILAVLLILPFGMFAQDKNNIITETFKVSGNCGMCKKTIEKAAKKEKSAKPKWNVNTKQLTVSYDKTKTNADAILKQVAYAGYDNEKFMAPEDAYNNLHECCKYDRVLNTGTTPAKTEDHSQHNKESTQNAGQNEVTLQTIYDVYFPLKDAMVNEDAKDASAKATYMLSQFEKVNMKNMESLQYDIYMDLSGKIKKDLVTIGETKNIDKQRKYFASLSENMFLLMKTFKPSYPVYFENCPMYNDGKGANWISKESQIRNPYYGSKMLSCGKVTETLK